MLRNDRAVLKCYTEAYDAHWHSALGATLAVLEAGYNIASLMLRYRGVDWRDMSSWDCNRRVNPVIELAYDGLNLHPLEIMFVSLSSAQLSGTHTLSRVAAKIDSWVSPVRSRQVRQTCYPGRRTMPQWPARGCPCLLASASRTK